MHLARSVREMSRHTKYVTEDMASPYRECGGLGALAPSGTAGALGADEALPLWARAQRKFEAGYDTKAASELRSALGGV